MYKKLLVTLSLIAGQFITLATPEKKVIIIIQNQEVHLPVRLTSLIGALEGFCVEGTPLQMSPITLVSLDTWKLIEDQLERVYAITHGDHQLRNEIIADYSQLDTTSLIDLISAVDFLTVSLLKEITLEIAQNTLTFDEILGLPEYMRNEIIKSKALSIAGAVSGREHCVYRGHDVYEASFCVTPDGKIVSGFWDKGVHIWDMNGQELAVCRGHEGWITSVCVTPDGKIVSGSWDKTVRVWDMNGQQLAVCRGHEGVARSVCVTPDGKIISGSWDKTVRVWGTNGQQLGLYRDRLVLSVCVTPDGNIISGFEDKAVRVWDMKGQILAVCRGHEDKVSSVCVTPDGKIVSGSWDKTVRVWDMNGRQLAVCRGHEDKVTSVCVTSDGKIVSGSWDKTVRVWDMKGQELAVCRGHKSVIHSVCVTPDGKIVSGSWDKTVRVWDLSLLHCLSSMNQDQAQTICKLLQSAICKNQKQKEQCWKKITKILEEVELDIETKKRKESGRKNNSRKRLRILEEEE